MFIGLALEIDLIKPPLTPGDLLQTRHLQPLPGFNHMNEFRRLKQREVSARIQPRCSSAQQLYVKRIMVQVNAVEIRDFQLATR